jgi:hypothetical protein
VIAIDQTMNKMQVHQLIMRPGKDARAKDHGLDKNDNVVLYRMIMFRIIYGMIPHWI